jgi:hypothetical protein
MKAGSRAIKAKGSPQHGGHTPGSTAIERHSRPAALAAGVEHESGAVDLDLGRNFAIHVEVRSAAQSPFQRPHDETGLPGAMS